MKGILFLLLVIGSLAGSFFLFSALFFGEGAPQQAALAAMACGVTIIPYCLLKGVAEITRSSKAPE